MLQQDIPLGSMIPPVNKSADAVKILMDGHGTLAYTLTRKLIENHGISTKHILVNTYDRHDNMCYIDWLTQQGIRHFNMTYRSETVFDLLHNFRPDYIISANGSRILPKTTLDLARIVAFNCHPSYLPDYRGRWTSSWPIINGEIEHGYTIHVMDQDIDTGPILFQKKIPILLDDTAYSLYNKTMCGFITVFDDFWQRLIEGKIISTPSRSGGRYYGKEIPYGGIINPSWDVTQIDKFIRGMFYPPYKGAQYLTKNGIIECSTLDDYFKKISTKT